VINEGIPSFSHQGHTISMVDFSHAGNPVNPHGFGSCLQQAGRHGDLARASHRHLRRQKVDTLSVESRRMLTDAGSGSMDLCCADDVRAGRAYIVDQIDIIPAETVFDEVDMCLDPAIHPPVWLNLVEELPTPVTETNGPACHILPHCRCGHHCEHFL